MDQCDRCKGFDNTDREHLVEMMVSAELCSSCFLEWIEYSGGHLTFQSLKKVSRRLDAMDVASNYAPRSPEGYKLVLEELERLMELKETLELAAWKLAKAWVRGSDGEKVKVKK